MGVVQLARVVVRPESTVGEPLDVGLEVDLPTLEINEAAVGLSGRRLRMRGDDAHGEQEENDENRGEMSSHW